MLNPQNIYRDALESDLKEIGRNRVRYHAYRRFRESILLRSECRAEFANPGATPSVSANGNKDAIVWAVATKTWNGPNQPVVLYAFNANWIDQPIYTSEQNSRCDRAAMATRFVIPVVVNGRVYFGARGEVEVYGLLK
jgi:hypothetical protein